MRILGLSPRFDQFDLTNKDVIVENDDGSAHASLTSKYKLVLGEKRLIAMVHCGVAYGIGDFDTWRERNGNLIGFNNRELEYALHKFLQLSDISFLFGMRFNLSSVALKVKTMLIRKPNGDARVDAFLTDGTDLYNVMIDGKPHDFSARSRELLRNHFLDCVPPVTEINAMRLTMFSPPFDPLLFYPKNPRVGSPHPEVLHTFCYEPERDLLKGSPQTIDSKSELAIPTESANDSDSEEFEDIRESVSKSLAATTE